MQYDYFLVNRAIQIQRLVEGRGQQRMEVPDRHSRGGCSRALSRLYRLIDGIRQLPVGDKQATGLLARLNISSFLSRKRKDSQKPLLTSVQRGMLLEFERLVVQVRLEDDPQSIQAGTEIFNAIVSDYEFFNGLKPLPQYPDDFAYELLFPSWLNLNTVMVQPTDDGRERFDSAQQHATLEFLQDWSQSQQDDLNLVAIMTIVTNRIDAPHSHQVLQRLIDLSFDRDGSAEREHVERLSLWQAESDSAATLAQWIEDYLFVYSCLHPTSHQKKYNVANKKVAREELPRAIRQLLPQIQDDDQQREPFHRLLDLVRSLIETTGGFEADWEQLINDHPSQLVDLLGLVVIPEGESRARIQPIQRLLAGIARRHVRDDGQVDIQRLKPFAQDVAPRMDGLSRSTTIFFEAEFVRKEQNRTAFLSACRGPDTRKKLSDRLIVLAQSAKQVDRFMHLVAMAAVLDPSIDASSLNGLHASVAVLQLSRTEQSIGRNELSDLIGDIRKNLPNSIATLARPLEAARGKSDRLAKLYLTLNEEAQILQHSGNISNFGVTRASFSHLEKLAEDEE